MRNCRTCKNLYISDEYVAMCDKWDLEIDNFILNENDDCDGWHPLLESEQL